MYDFKEKEILLNILLDERVASYPIRNYLFCPDDMLVGIGLFRKGSTSYIVMDFTAIGYKPYDDLLDPDILTRSGYYDFLHDSHLEEVNTL